MRTLSLRNLVVAAALALVAGCPGGAKLPGGGGLPNKPDVPGGGDVPGGLPVGGGLDPGACGNYAASDAGRKLKMFLTATQDLEKTVVETAEIVKTSCKMMGKELGMPPGELDKGTGKEICERVITTIRDNMKVAFKPNAKLKVTYKPAVCSIDVNAAASAAAECEAKAKGDVKVTCQGGCAGTCGGKCDGTCHGKTGAGGKCDGHCDGTCKGSCSGGCDGHADVEASAECKAHAEVQASVDVQCTEPELKIEAEAGIIVDKSKAEMTLKALRTGIPKILSVRGRLKPLQGAVKTWVASATRLKDAGKDLANSFKDQALCITGQIAAAAGMIANISAQLEFSVSISVEASATAQVN
jgi:hypothetical protein